MRLLLLGAAIGLLHAQSAAPAFEVASVKRHLLPEGDLRRPWSPNIDCGPVIAECGLVGDRFNDEFASLVDLMMDAYKFRRYQISGLPSWGDSGHDLYDVNARMGGTNLTLDQARRMLQTLLAERFQLKIHHETKDLPVYGLVAAKNGPRLKASDKPCMLPGPRNGGAGRGAGKAGGPGGVVGLENTWPMVPEMVGRFADRPVIDKTGLKDAPYYCTLDGMDPLYTVMTQARLGSGGEGRGDRGAADSGEVSIFTVLDEKLGLKLEPQKGPMDVLVIDHVERPSEN